MYVSQPGWQGSYKEGLSLKFNVSSNAQCVFDKSLAVLSFAVSKLKELKFGLHLWDEHGTWEIHVSRFPLVR